MTDSIYEQIGGAGSIDKAVDIFYRKVLADDSISRFFEGIDMEQQSAKQRSFLTMALGGPNNYTSKDMRAGHAHLVKQGLDDPHFDAVLVHLGDTLVELGVPAEMVATIAAKLEGLRPDILGR